MINVTSNLPVSTMYPSSGLEAGLIVTANVYEISTGTPNLAFTYSVPQISTGYYAANFVPASAKAYLAILTAVPASPDGVTRAPWAEIYKCSDAAVTFAAFNYGSFDQETDLNVGAQIYDITTGSPSVVPPTIAMPHVANGIYLGFFTGQQNHTYQAAKYVFTDDTLSTISTSFPPGSDSFQLTISGITNLFVGPVLIGQKLQATLKGQSLSARLVET